MPDVDSKIWAQGFADGLSAARREIIAALWQGALVLLIAAVIARHWWGKHIQSS